MSTVTNPTMELYCILLPLTLPCHTTWQIANSLVAAAYPQSTLNSTPNATCSSLSGLASRETYHRPFTIQRVYGPTKPIGGTRCVLKVAITSIKGRQMGHRVTNVMVSLWCKSLLTNTRFRVLYFKMKNCKAHLMLHQETELAKDSGRPLSYYDFTDKKQNGCC